MLLSVSVGLPFLVLSASAPMLQAWFGQTGDRSARDPYFLYAASNLGSLLALLSYPLVIESHLTLRQQSWCWAAGYGLLMMLVACCAVQLWRSSPVSIAMEQTALQGRVEEPIAERPNARRRLWWLALSLIPSSLLMGVTTYISTDIAAIPLLWVIPLALYLLTFVLVFARRSLLPLPWMLRAEPYLIVAAAAALASSTLFPIQLLLVGSLQLLTFFVIAMVCHGQLAGDRPARRHLTEFYLWMSLGGVLGGLFNALLAPLIFSGAVEYPLILAIACLLRPRTAASRPTAWAWVRQGALPATVLLVCGGLAWMMCLQAAPMELRYADSAAVKLLVLPAAVAAFFLRRRPLQFGLGVAALLAVSLCCPNEGGHLLHAERSFFGVLRVTEDPLWNTHSLSHGSTTHGSQSLDQNERREPLTYYHRTGPLGQIFRTLQPRRPLAEIGVLGLGTGAIAAYGQAGERITFYEIDPAVEHIARKTQYFTYLADCRAKVEVVMGDARLSLVHGPLRTFDLLVVNVFSSDSVPIHLVTREAIRIYVDRLADHGLLAIHISSRFLNLGPIVGRLAKDAGLAVWICQDLDASAPGKLASDWVVMARRAEDLASLARDPAWRPLDADGGRVWTDDFSNVVGAIQWKSSWNKLLPPTWGFQGDEAESLNAIATILNEQGRFDEAIPYLRKALKIKPDHAVAHNNLGYAVASRGRLDEAIAEYQKALEIKPDYAVAHNNLGGALAGRGQFDEAIAEYQKALEIKPDYVEARTNLGYALAGRAARRGHRRVSKSPGNQARLRDRSQ